MSCDGNDRRWQIKRNETISLCRRRNELESIARFCFLVGDVIVYYVTAMKSDVA